MATGSRLVPGNIADAPFPHVYTPALPGRFGAPAGEVGVLLELVGGVGFGGVLAQVPKASGLLGLFCRIGGLALPLEVFWVVGLIPVSPSASADLADCHYHFPRYWVKNVGETYSAWPSLIGTATGPLLPHEVNAVLVLHHVSVIVPVAGWYYPRALQRDVLRKRVGHVLARGGLEGHHVGV